MRQRVRGNAHRHAVEAGKREIGDGAIGQLGKHERQGSRPEGGRQPLGGGAETAEPPRGLRVCNMGDQRVEGGPPLGGVKAGHRLAVVGVGAEPVDGFGRKRDQPALAQAARRGLDRGGGGL